MTGTDLIVIDPRNGEVVDDISEQPSDLLAAFAVEFKRRADMYAEMRKAVEAELLERMQAQDRRRAIVGDFEINVESTGYSRVWDPDALEQALDELVAQSTIVPGEWTGLIREETKVNGRLAQRLLGSLTGQAKAAVEACFTWERKGGPRLTVVPNVQLPAPDNPQT